MSLSFPHAGIAEANAKLEEDLRQAELRRLFTDNCAKLGTICAELGLGGDEDAAVLKDRAHALVQDRNALLDAGRRIVRSAQPALGGHYMVPAVLMADLSHIITAIEAAQGSDHASSLMVVVRELMLAVEFIRSACEHTEGASVIDADRLLLGVSVGIRVNAKYKHLLADYQKDTFWNEVMKLPARLGCPT